MQTIPSLENAVFAVPGLLIGMLLGYIIGGVEDFSMNYRIGLGIIISFFAGLITELLLYVQFNISTFEIILIILSYFGGYALGAVANWAPLPEKPPKRHIIFEPDDDDEFDRELEETMGGSFKANNS